MIRNNQKLDVHTTPHKTKTSRQKTRRKFRSKQRFWAKFEAKLLLELATSRVYYRNHGEQFLMDVLFVIFESAAFFEDPVSHTTHHILHTLCTLYDDMSSGAPRTLESRHELAHNGTCAQPTVRCANYTRCLD